MALRVSESRFAGFALRLVSGVLLAVLALGAAHAGGVWFLGLVGLGIILMAVEWPALCLAGAGREPLWRPRPPFAALLFVALVIGAAVFIVLGRYCAAVFAAGLGALVVAVSARGACTDRLLLGAGVPYIIAPAAALVWLSCLPGGAWILTWLFAVVWATDIGGYAFGKSLGGPKLAPAISPGKTWAGFFGGTLLAAGASAAFAPLAQDPLRLAVLGIGVSIASQLGDLLESAVKRRFEVKDSGCIIPGHGGVFDRLDGLLVAAVLVAAVLVVAGDKDFLWR
jgi:phosphatidate cytidylyltransferase